MHNKCPGVIPGHSLLVEMAGESRGQGACPLRGAFGGLDSGFPGVHTSVHTGSEPSFALS